MPASLPAVSSPTQGGEPADRYTMRISRLTIDKLGIKMYDRVSAVLAELLANAYDADATTVTATLPWGEFLASNDPTVGDLGFTITIVDDGHGMTAKEINEHYLQVGSDRRARLKTDKSRGGRPVMGRKGIGKLAPFGICQTVEVISAGGSLTKRGYAVSHLILDLGAMLTDTEQPYHPTPGHLDETWANEHGTTVVLRNFRRKRVPDRDELNRQIAARFGLRQAGWNITVVNSANLAQSFQVGDLAIDILADTRIELKARPVTIDGKVMPVTGWVAYSKHPYKHAEMAGVRIYARGKIVAQTRDFGIGAGFHGEYKLRSYLVGEITAEWLDEGEDLVRSDRQDIIWTSEAGEAFSAWGQELLRELGGKGEQSVNRQVWDEFKEASNIEQRVKDVAPNDKSFRDSVVEAARLLVSNKDRQAIADKDHIERLVQLAFSIGPHQSLLSSLRDVAENADSTLGMLVSLFDKARVAEVYSLGTIARERVDALGNLERMISNKDTLEGPLQELIESAPWLIAPEWTPLGMNESLKRVRAAFEAWYTKKHGVKIFTSAINRERKEPDFVLLHDAGTLMIIEIKRMNYHLTGDEYDRAVNYLEDLHTFLEENSTLGQEFPRRELVLVVDHIDKLNNSQRSSLNSDDRIERRTWHEVLNSTKRAHKDFLAYVDQLRQGPSSA